MTDYRLSFLKTTAFAIAAVMFALVFEAVLVEVTEASWDVWSGPVLTGLSVSIVIVGLATIWLVVAMLGGLIALHRDALETQGRPYGAGGRREKISGPAIYNLLFLLGRWFSRIRGSREYFGFRPGESVEIKSLREISSTLDSNGTLDGVPFMPEMAAFCGTHAQVFRRIEKLNDWVHNTGFKRMRNLVLLEGLRCDGSSHGGCQANCHLRWREEWLRRPGKPDSGRSNVEGSIFQHDLVNLNALAARPDTMGGVRYFCQATELTVGGIPLKANDPRHYLRDFVTGNIRFAPLMVGVSIACFNWVQRIRGGVQFPHYYVGTSKTSPTESLGLEAGDIVRVKPKHLIEATLNDRSRNRGLWFDKEMLRCCGKEYRVKARLERVLVEKTGELRELTNPCVVLDGVTATGEYLRFNPENEHIFWREIWLEVVTRVASTKLGQETETGQPSQ